jgi:hypothetical protein
MAWKSFIGSWDKMKLSRTDAIRIVVLEASCFQVALEAIIPVNRDSSKPTSETVEPTGRLVELEDLARGRFGADSYFSHPE